IPAKAGIHLAAETELDDGRGLRRALDGSRLSPGRRSRTPRHYKPTRAFVSYSSSAMAERRRPYCLRPSWQVRRQLKKRSESAQVSKGRISTVSTPASARREAT